MKSITKYKNRLIIAILFLSSCTVMFAGESGFNRHKSCTGYGNREKTCANPNISSQSAKENLFKGGLKNSGADANNGSGLGDPDDGEVLGSTPVGDTTLWVFAIGLSSYGIYILNRKKRETVQGARY